MLRMWWREALCGEENQVLGRIGNWSIHLDCFVEFFVLVRPPLVNGCKLFFFLALEVIISPQEVVV